METTTTGEEEEAVVLTPRLVLREDMAVSAVVAVETGPVKHQVLGAVQPSIQVQMEPLENPHLDFRVMLELTLEQEEVVVLAVALMEALAVLES